MRFRERFLWQVILLCICRYKGNTEFGVEKELAARKPSKITNKIANIYTTTDLRQTAKSLGFIIDNSSTST